MVLRERYYAAIEYEINRILLELLYKPLTALFERPTELLNTRSPLQDAVVSGRIWYVDGQFHGEFSARLSAELERIGAVYNPRAQTFSLAREDLPDELRIAQGQADSRYDALRRGLLQTLNDIDIDSINLHSKMPDRMMQSIDRMNGDFEKAIRAITIPPKLTETQRGLLASEWGYNLDLYIKNFASQEIISLRDQVQSNAFGGKRASALVDMIRHSYGVSNRKAKFLARQETSLMMSKFRETRYKGIGITKYRWSTSHDKRVRHDHRHLDGKVFSWDDPPVTNRETGARNNPGEDFNCRCIAVALVD